MEPGQIVEFIDDRNFLTAVVTRIKGHKLLVLGENDREMNVSSNRILHISSHRLNPSKPRIELVRDLKDISTRRSGLGRDFNVQELWELTEGEGEEFGYDFLAELYWSGPLSGDHVAAAQRSVFADGVYFKMKPVSAIRHSAEKVEQIILSKKRENEKELELGQGAAWLKRVWNNDLSDEPACRDHVVRVLKDMAVLGSDASEYKWGQKLLERSGVGGDPWRPFRLLVKMGEMSVHENLELIREEIPTDFTPELLAEAESLARSELWREEERKDLTDLEVITADSGGARDFDDAVSLEEKKDRLILGVHIADVSSLIRAGSNLEKEAQLRTTTIYTPDQRITMLPEVLSDECLSLKEGEVRPAFTMRAELTPEGEVLEYDFFPSLIKVKRQLSYQEVDAAVESDLLLGRMFRLSKALKARRTINGAMILPLPKLNVFLTPEGEIGVNLTLWENPGRSMISEFMILANYLAARKLHDLDAGCYYRCQNDPTERIVPGDSDCRDLFLCLKQRRFLQRVSWRVDPMPHSGMGLDVYTNLTSPLRRFIDLIIQRQIRSLANGTGPIYPREYMAEILTNVEVVRRKAMRIQNNRRRYWFIRYLENQPPKEYDALVLEKLPHRWRIFLTEYMLDADLPIMKGRTLEPGQTIGVRVRKTHAREDILKFELV